MCRNEGGNFLKFEAVPLSARGRSVKLYFPAGKEGDGWLNAAKEMEKFTGVQSARPGSGGGGILDARR